MEGTTAGNINRHWVKAARPEGDVRESDFEFRSGPIPEPGAGEFLIQTLYLSLAPVMRMYMLDGAGFEKPLAIGDTMRGRGVGRVIKSNNPDFAPGDIVHGKLGWQEYAISDGSPYFMMYKVRQRVAPFSTALGVLGVTGFTAYLGLVDIGKPRAGETVLVSGAAGGVGSSVGQIARNLGCKTVGLAGGPEKCALLSERLGYDKAIDYRAGNIEEQIRKACPDGVDVFFDNAGGEILDAGLNNINRFARIVLCGRISEYVTENEAPYALKNYVQIHRNCAMMQAFFIYDIESDFPRAEAAMARWIAEGRLTWQEDILDGIENMPRALIRLYQGKNQGKQLVKVSD